MSALTTVATRIAVETTQKVEVKVKPSLKRKLLNELQAYATLYHQIAALELKRQKSLDILEECVIESGEQSLTLEGTGTATLVFPVRKKLNKKLFVQQGGTLAQLENATENVPSKHYLLVTLPGQKERIYDND